MGTSRMAHGEATKMSQQTSGSDAASLLASSASPIAAGSSAATRGPRRKPHVPRQIQGAAPSEASRSSEGQASQIPQEAGPVPARQVRKSKPKSRREGSELVVKVEETHGNTANKASHVDLKEHERSGGNTQKSHGSKPHRHSKKLAHSGPGPGTTPGDDGKAVRWWTKLRDVDPITLMPLSSLRYPPFELDVDNSELKHRFDPKALATYLLNTGNFVDPINRQPMTREDCAKLDALLKASGFAESAKCEEMLELQNNLKQSAEADNAPTTSVLRDASVIAAHLFHYPSVREAPVRRRDAPSSSRAPSQRGRSGVPTGVSVTDDDDQWETWPEDASRREDFPQLPGATARPAPTLVEEFPAIGRSTAATTTRVVAPRPAPSPISWASVAETSKTRKIDVPLPKEPASADPSVLSWRSAPDRPKLNLVRLEPLHRSEAPVARSEAIFGKAQPVDTDHVFEASKTVAHSGDTTKDYLCPYPPKILRAAKSFGATWLAGIEKKFKDLVDDGSSRKVIQLEPMPEQRRYLVHYIATRFWGLQVVELDPEPYRFQQVSIAAVPFEPDILLHKALTYFPHLLNAEVSLSGSPTTGILFIGCPSSVTTNRVHELMRDVCQARPSEYDIDVLEGYRLDEKNVFVGISSSERARRMFKKLSSSGPIPGFRCRKVEWWPAGIEWAKHQIKALQKGNDHVLEPVRAQQKLDEKRHRQEELARTGDTAWDDAPRGMADEKIQALRERLQKSTDWDDDASNSDNSDADSDDESK